MKKSLLILAIFITNLAIAQNITLKPNELVNQFKKSDSMLAVHLLDAVQNRSLQSLPEQIEHYDILRIDASGISSLMAQRNSGITMTVSSGGELLDLELVLTNPFAPGFAVTEMPSGIIHALSDRDMGLHYRGVVAGKKGSMVALSVFGNEIAAVVSWPGMSGNLVLGKLENATDHILYRDADILDQFELNCTTDTQTDSGKQRPFTENQVRSTNNCVAVHFDVSNEIYVGKGGLAPATSYMTTLFNQVLAIYTADNIGLSMAGITVWSSAEPFGDLGAFQSYRNSNVVSGDLNSYINYSYGGGVAYLNGLCSGYRYSVSGIGSSFGNVPTYSWSVMVVSHELGHNMGSQHTHDCVWNGNSTSIDGCGFNAGYGGCSAPEPAVGGTIMSYCHLSSVGINFTQGFGPQPTARISAYVDASPCPGPCGPPACDDGFMNGDETGVDCGGSCPEACPTCIDGILNGDEIEIDCGGPLCPSCPCTGESVTLTILLDNYPEETSWTITDSNGGIVAQGGTYGSEPDGSTLAIDVCLNDGCYDLNFNDSFGDGICCGYGIGNYVLTDAADNVLASGGEFLSSEVTNFCLTTTPACQAPNTLDVVEIGFGTSNPRVNATWVNPEGTVSCEVRGGRISNASYTAGEPEFANALNTQTITQTNGSTVNFNIALYNNPNIPFTVGTRYGYEVRCACSDNSGFSSWANITPEATFVVPAAPAGKVTGNTKLLSAGVNTMSVYPNPTEGLVNIEIELAEEGSVEIILMNALGQTVAQERASGTAVTNRMDVSDLDAGIYMLSVRTASGIITERLIVK